MAENQEIPGLDGLVSALTGEPSSLPQTLASTFAETAGGGRPGSRPPFGGSRPPTSSLGAGSILNTFENLIFGSRRRSAPPIPPRPQRLRQVNPRRPPPIRRPVNRPPFINRREDTTNTDFRPSAPIRTKRQTRLQGNIIRYEERKSNAV